MAGERGRLDIRAQREKLTHMGLYGGVCGYREKWAGHPPCALTDANTKGGKLRNILAT